jgi:hypothetical protein
VSGLEFLLGLGNIVQVILLAWIADGPRRARQGSERRSRG